MCIDESVFPALIKTSMFLPLLKKETLQTELISSYRPVSNFFSIVSERLIFLQLLDRLENFNTLD